jgi:uronate dehydrogenase
MRLADRAPIRDPGPESEVVALDIRDADACRAACRGVDMVLHLAADPRPGSQFVDDLLPVNIIGAYNMFEAAARERCSRFVFASSAQAVEAYPLDVQVPEGAPPRPANLYGCTKAFGEALGAYFAHSHGMTTIAARIANLAVFRA